ncbi:hypothetical protein SGR_1875 [Streptomyces griseus subsp. griseus NBRC 13350]|uniref:Uncharacterized protein n=1 Tax=Streptomyces griseus subsp. griseus (strain JCM 4626 / CBS 651.72 / NBRC 13350 / KCC S-0626 / ISP 5235) TaxID=455632 RepID=B1VYU9_STRGG|nr:hypothetical protein SGR_1875 [Streptomyces griseus subsp. griseus NBRC 13350]
MPVGSFHAGPQGVPILLLLRDTSNDREAIYEAAHGLNALSPLHGPTMNLHLLQSEQRNKPLNVLLGQIQASVNENRKVQVRRRGLLVGAKSTIHPKRSPLKNILDQVCIQLKSSENTTAMLGVRSLLHEDLFDLGQRRSVTTRRQQTTVCERWYHSPPSRRLAPMFPAPGDHPT